MSTTITCKVHFGIGARGKRRILVGAGPEPGPETKAHPGRGRVPRAARLMALAIRCERLIAGGAIADRAELARLGHVTRARITQIMNLLHLAPDIREAILALPPVTEGRDPVTERDLRPIAAEVCWARQRAMWKTLIRTGPEISSASKCAVLEQDAGLGKARVRGVGVRATHQEEDGTTMVERVTRTTWCSVFGGPTRTGVRNTNCRRCGGP